MTSFKKMKEAELEYERATQRVEIAEHNKKSRKRIVTVTSILIPTVFIAALVFKAPAVLLILIGVASLGALGALATTHDDRGKLDHMRYLERQIEAKHHLDIAKDQYNQEVIRGFNA